MTNNVDGKVELNFYITDVNEPPLLRPQDSRDVKEDGKSLSLYQAGTDQVGKICANDPDLLNNQPCKDTPSSCQTITYTILAGTNPGNLFNLRTGTGDDAGCVWPEITSGKQNMFDFEGKIKFYEITIVANDGFLTSPPSGQMKLKIVVLDNNDKPVLEDATLSIGENRGGKILFCFFENS